MLLRDKESRIASWNQGKRMVVGRLRLLLGALHYKATFTNSGPVGLLPQDDVIWFGDPCDPSRPNFAVLPLSPRHLYGDVWNAIDACIHQNAAFVWTIDVPFCFVTCYRVNRRVCGFNASDFLRVDELPEITISMAVLFSGIDTGAPNK